MLHLPKKKTEALLRTPYCSGLEARQGTKFAALPCTVRYLAYPLYDAAAALQILWLNRAPSATIDTAAKKVPNPLKHQGHTICPQFKLHFKRNQAPPIKTGSAVILLNIWKNKKKLRRKEWRKISHARQQSVSPCTGASCVLCLTEFLRINSPGNQIDIGKRRFCPTTFKRYGVGLGVKQFWMNYQ